VPASGRFARGTVMGGDHVGVLPHSTDFSRSLYREVVLTSLHSNRPFLSNTLMEHYPVSGSAPTWFFNKWWRCSQSLVLNLKSSVVLFSC